MYLFFYILEFWITTKLHNFTESTLCQGKNWNECLFGQLNLVSVAFGYMPSFLGSWYISCSVAFIYFSHTTETALYNNIPSWPKEQWEVNHCGQQLTVNPWNFANAPSDPQVWFCFTLSQIKTNYAVKYF